MVALILIGAFMVCALPFYPAVHEWLVRSDASPLVVVREQDTNIRHFAASFFEQIQDFYTQHHVDPLNPPGSFRGSFGDDGDAAFIGAQNKPDFTDVQRRTRRTQEMLIAAGDLMLEGDFVFEKEIYCGRQLYAGSNNTYRAVYAGTDLILGRNSTVARWLHSQGHVYIGQESRVYGRISSASSITLAAGVFFERLNANVIRFESDTLVNVSAILKANAQAEWQTPKNALEIDENTLLFDQNISLPDNVKAVKNIISKRELFLGEGCRVSGNLKARESLMVGAASVVRGSLVCEGDIRVGRSSLVVGPIVSESRITIDADCVIGAPRIPTSVTAPIVEIVVGSEISGTLWASKAGTVMVGTNKANVS
ncbi:MAG: hypothetical protein ACU84Q_12775 [Gammaproteobacteria bacterium]